MTHAPSPFASRPLHHAHPPSPLRLSLIRSLFLIACCCCLGHHGVLSPALAAAALAPRPYARARRYLPLRPRRHRTVGLHGCASGSVPSLPSCFALLCLHGFFFSSVPGPPFPAASHIANSFQPFQPLHPKRDANVGHLRCAGAHMFWWLYYSDKVVTSSNLPLVLWLQGGPVSLFNHELSSRVSCIIKPCILMMRSLFRASDIQKL